MTVETRVRFGAINVRHIMGPQGYKRVELELTGEDRETYRPLLDLTYKNEDTVLVQRDMHGVFVNGTDFSRRQNFAKPGTPEAEAPPTYRRTPRRLYRLARKLINNAPVATEIRRDLLQSFREISGWGPGA